MGLLDLIVSKKQRLENQRRRLEKENRELQAEVDVQRIQKRNDTLRKELAEGAD